MTLDPQSTLKYLYNEHCIVLCIDSLSFFLCLLGTLDWNYREFTLQNDGYCGLRRKGLVPEKNVLHRHQYDKNFTDITRHLQIWPLWMDYCYKQILIGHCRVPKTLTFKMRPSAQPFLWKLVSSAREWKIISISKAEYLTSFWYGGPGELRNNLFGYQVMICFCLGKNNLLGTQWCNPVKSRVSSI